MRGLMKILEKFPPFSLFLPLFFSRPNLGAIAFDVTVNYEIVQQAAQRTALSRSYVLSRILPRILLSTLSIAHPITNAENFPRLNDKWWTREILNVAGLYPASKSFRFNQGTK